MHFVTLFALGVCSLATANPVGNGANLGSSPAAGQCGDMRMQCKGLSLLCCDKLEDDNAANKEKTSGIFKNCHGIHTPFMADMAEVDASCDRTPACCDAMIKSGPPSAALECTSLQGMMGTKSS